MNPLKGLTIFVIFLVLFSACEPEIYLPKPRGYPKVNFPERTLKTFDQDFCAFTFEFPDYAKVTQKSLYFDQQAADPCWFDLSLPPFNGQVHFSYYPIEQAKDLEKFTLDAFDLAGKHQIKADYIDELPIRKDATVNGFAFDIEGAVASPFQFYLTDSTQHFLRGALYFNTQSNPDSLAPVVNFVKTDLMQLINTFEWKLKG